MLNHYLPQRVNTGPWIAAYTLEHLRSLPEKTEFVLPVCSLATPYKSCQKLGQYLLPPLFHEALTPELKLQIVARIQECFPEYLASATGNDEARLRVVELPQSDLPTCETGRIVAFSVDTAVEEHGPHLPLGTDTIQSYAVLNELAKKNPEIELARPLEYGQLTWGLPFGFSVDVTAELLKLYVHRYTRALVDWQEPKAVYVVDVHGSIVHRQAIVDGLEMCKLENYAFRWLHEPLVEFASSRGDQHAGGVETALVEFANQNLVDSNWWPDRIDEIAGGQMGFETAVELSGNLTEFLKVVKLHGYNGIVGDIKNYRAVDAKLMFDRMFQVAMSDIERLRHCDPTPQNAGKNLW